MEFYVNGTKIDVELENEKTIGDVLRGFEEECAKSNATTVSIIVDGKNISAEDFDKTAEKPLCPDTKIELGIISQEAIENSFNNSSKRFSHLVSSSSTISKIALMLSSTRNVLKIEDSCGK